MLPLPGPHAVGKCQPARASAPERSHARTGPRARGAGRLLRNRTLPSCSGSPRSLKNLPQSFERQGASLPQLGEQIAFRPSMHAWFFSTVFLGVLAFSGSAGATIFGSVNGLIHDPQHRPVQGAKVTLRAASSEWFQTAESDSAGEFRFVNIPLGDYRVTVEAAGFATEEQKIVLNSGRDARPHFSLSLAREAVTVEVQDVAPSVNPESSSSTNLVTREAISQTPGADTANSLNIITNYTPGAYMVHDQLHIRGGHQVSWLLDGVPVPNTNIASNVGPQFDPKDIDYLEVQRGGYSAEYGDRTFGVFNVVTRSGFERDRQGEVVLGYGNYNETNPQISFGDHTERFAWYGSLSGYRTDLGLETP